MKGELMDHKEVTAAIGVKVVAPGLEGAVAGTNMFVVSLWQISCSEKLPQKQVAKLLDCMESQCPVVGICSKTAGSLFCLRGE